jgi:predicted transcriptional regulator
MEETLKKVLGELEMIRKIKMIELVERGYSQRKLGDALGISQATVSRMMAGKRPPKEKADEKPVADE